MNNLVAYRQAGTGLKPVWDNFFNDFFDYELRYDFKRPAVNVLETDLKYRFEVELPGFAEDEIDVNVEKNILEIKAEKKDQEKTEEKENPVVKKLIWERYSRFSRKFILPENTDIEKVEAKYENGILSLEINKKEEELPRKIKIN